MAAKVPAYPAIGQQAKEVLSGSKEGIYQYNKKASVSSRADVGVVITSSVAATESGSTEQSIKAAYKQGNWSFSGNVQHSGQVALSAGYVDLTPGLLLTVNGTYPTLTTTSKLNVDYCVPHATLKGTVSLEQQPVLDASLTFGENNLFAGVDASYSTKENNATKYNFGAGWTTKDFQVGLQLNDKLQTVKAVYAHVVDSRTVLAAEASHPLSKDSAPINITLGVQKRLDNGLLAKVKVNDRSIVDAHLEGLIHPKVLGGLSLQFNAKDSQQAPKWGFAASTSL